MREEVVTILVKTRVLQPDRARFRFTQEQERGRQAVCFQDGQRLHARSAGNCVTCPAGAFPHWFRDSLWSISNVPSLAVGEGDRAVDKTPESLLPGCRQTEAAATQPTRKPPGTSGCERHSFGGGRSKSRPQRGEPSRPSCAQTLQRQKTAQRVQSLG